MGKKSSDGANPRTTASKLADLAQIKKEIHVDQANESITKQHAKGKQSARERLASLLDPESFQEIDELVRESNQFLFDYLVSK